MRQNADLPARQGRAGVHRKFAGSAIELSMCRPTALIVPIDGK
jgi:hypothetical protein